MFFAELLFAFVFALVLSWLLGVIFRWQPPGVRGYWSSLLFLFAILFLGSWAGGVWLTPFGPTAWGIIWLPFVLTGFIVALVLLAVVPNRRPRNVDEAEEQADLQAGTEGIVGVTFWILIIALIISIVAHYFLR